MVEFALVGPLLLILLLCAVDFGRGVFYYTQMAGGAREAARQAALQYNQDTNTSPGACTSCQVPGVVPLIQRMAAFGYPVVYVNSSSTSRPPDYPSAGSASTYTAATCATPPCDQPGTITLNPAAKVNTVYVFVYELDPSTGNAVWAAPGASTTTPIRNGGHRKVVVDLKFKFQPVVLTYLGLGSSLQLDAQTEQREEYS
jgi:hypothetical protein